MQSRLAIMLSTSAMLAATGAMAATRLSPTEIQTSFFDGKAFTATTPSKIEFKLVFTPDGKVSREPVGKSGTKGEGTWKLSKDGFCTTWKNAKQSCFTLVVAGANRWTVMRGPANVATWSR
jgi:hypothetical protein